jgi:nicotinate-nucleotide pyrophosphorylase (carboxylating)
MDGCPAWLSAPNPTPCPAPARRPWNFSRSNLANNRLFAFPFFIRRHLVRVELTTAEIRRAVRRALAEDIGGGDVTTLATVPPNARSIALMRAREPLVVAGIQFAEMAFRELSSKIEMKKIAGDGAGVKAGDTLLKISGSSRAILSAERAQILDTRKTTPGWRRFEKYAVACGGGKNHRLGLFDMVLIKDNHLVALQNEKPNAIAAAVLRARKKFPKLEVEVEADTLEQAAQAAAAGADVILLDNMPSAQLRRAVKIVHGRAQTEASGGVNLHTVRAIALTGVDLISVGAITHSARAVDIGLDFA